MTISGTPEWFDRPMRWAQLTLVENDPAQYDVDFWLDYFRRAHCDAACLSAGGCVCYYPTQIPLHYRSPWMGDRDPFGELYAGCRKLGMNVIARTDPHAVHQDVYDAHPDWIMVDANGQRRRHWAAPDLWVTCALGPYNPNTGGSTLSTLDMKRIGKMADFPFADPQARRGLEPVWSNGKTGKVNYQSSRLASACPGAITGQLDNIAKCASNWRTRRIRALGRDALTAVCDHAVPQPHPLLANLTRERCQTQPGELLRGTRIGTIERRRPPERESSFGFTAWRRYLLLCGRFVNSDSHASSPDSRLVSDRCAAAHMRASLSRFAANHHAYASAASHPPPDTSRYRTR